VGFSDRINWFVKGDQPEIWNIFNFTTDTHPVHLHLVQFQVLRRDTYDAPKAGDDGLLPPGALVKFQHSGNVDANEAGWKDTVRVNPGDGIAIAAIFAGFTGRFMYHCHVLEHEDDEMMRPFIVMPKEVHPFMPNMGGGDHGGMMH
jgi:spore coat protein A